MNTLLISKAFNGQDCYMGVVSGLEFVNGNISGFKKLKSVTEISKNQIKYLGNNNYFPLANIGFASVEALTSWSVSRSNFITGEIGGFEQIDYRTASVEFLNDGELAFSFCIQNTGAPTRGYWLSLFGYCFRSNQWYYVSNCATTSKVLPSAATSYLELPTWVCICTNEENDSCFLLGIKDDSTYFCYPMEDTYGIPITMWPSTSVTDKNPDPNIPIPPPNPYEPGGPSGPGDLPPGSFDDDSDSIPDSSLPTISAANTGFTRIYNPTLSQVQSLAQYLWTTPDIIETIWNHIKQFFENPMDAIIGFNLVPVPVPDGGTENFKLMYIDTGVAMTAASNQFVDRDCGTVEIKRYYGSALDQSPYTKVSCFLPYIGTVQLNTDEVMGTTLQVKYRVDICSGSCVAKIFIDGNCLYQYSGHCAINIPISSADFSSYVSAAINVAKLAVGAATAGAGGAAMAAAQVAGSEQQTGNMFTSQFGGSSQNLPALPQSYQEPQQSEQTTTSASFAGLSPANVSNTVGEIMNAKPHVEHSGSFSGNTGYLGVRRPFIIIERPNMCMPANYQALNGFPAMITMELGTCKGFTRVQQVQLTGMTATNPEQAEILELLKSGVVL